MNRDEFDEKITKLVTAAIYEDHLKLLDIIAVFESAKMSIAIMMHESARNAGVV